ncbi:hypothetical protein D3C84_842410 [compost metagenome]
MALLSANNFTLADSASAFAFSAAANLACCASASAFALASAANFAFSAPSTLVTGVVVFLAITAFGLDGSIREPSSSSP